MSDPPPDGMHPARAALHEALQEQVTEELAPRLEIVRLLGRGSAAIVLLAREPALRRLVAVKVLSPELANDRKAHLRFQHEAQWAARVSHPNVVTVYWVDVLSSGLPYIVMQHVRGRSLEERLKAEGPLEVAEVRRILADLASGLAAAHRKGIIHRDVRPANVLYDEDTQRVLLTDFGIAAILASGDEEVPHLTTAGHLLGDPRYGSPEHLSGDEITELADVYSLGLVGFELLTAEGPYSATDPAELIAAHLRGEPRRVRDLRPETDEDLDALLLRCLAKTPTHRPSAVDVARQLRTRERERAGERERETESPSLRPDGPPAPRRRPEVAPSGEAAVPLEPPDGVLRLHTLGSLDLVARDGRRLLSVLTQPKRIALLAYLAIGSHSGFKRRDSLLGVFWPDSDQERARHALRQAIFVLRRGLGASVLVSRGDEEIGLDPGQLWCDAVAFEATIDGGEGASALDHFSGDLLPGFYVSDSPGFERWLENQRRRLRRRASDTAWSLSEQREQEGDAPGATTWAHRALDYSPLDEASLCRLMELLDRLGDRAGAILAYEGFARVLATEYEAEPAPETQALIETVRSR